MDDILKQTYLYDFYGELLTEHQKEVYAQVVLEDYSLSEVAKELGKSRQSVHDLIKRSTKTLEDYEAKLHLVEKFMSVKNKVQEIMDKYDSVKPVRWHMIGHLQTNKVKYIIDKVSMIHSVDSYKLAEEINKRAGQHGLIMDILIQVNSAQEESKFGVSTEDAEDLLRMIMENCPNINICGLMCVAPKADDPKDIAVYFADVKKLYDRFAQIDHERINFKYLSMGMSHDFEVAIEEGSNMIRVGTAIFGERDYSKQK